jgi:hypothetical protein
MVRDVARSALLLAIALRLGIAPLAAQGIGADSSAAAVQGYAPSTSPGAVPSLADLAAIDPSVVAGAIVLPVRSEAEVKQAISAAGQELSRADTELTLTGERRARAGQLVEARQRQLAEAEAKIRQADRDKQKAMKAALEAEKKAVERQQSLAEDLLALTDAEIDVAKKAREVAIANQQALELEQLLVGKRADRAGLADPAAAHRAGAVIRELERQTLVAQKAAAGLERDLAGKKDFLLSKRLDLYKAYLQARGLKT